MTVTRRPLTPQQASEPHDAAFGRRQGRGRYCRFVERRCRRCNRPALSCLVTMVAVTVTALRWAAAAVPRPGQPRPALAPRPAPCSAPVRTLRPLARPPQTGGAPGRAALIDVAVATLWVGPGLARPIDEPSATNPVDIARWVATMTVADKQWLVGKLATQALYGEPVVVMETRGAWTKVVVTDQPSSQDPRGYPGWLPTVQLTFSPAPDSGQ